VAASRCAVGEWSPLLFLSESEFPSGCNHVREPHRFGTICLERYRDSEALIEHAAHLGDLTEAILATGSVSGELLGEPTAELRAKLADSEVRLFTPFQSM
jgi:hypothetical protein